MNTEACFAYFREPANFEGRGEFVPLVSKFVRRRISLHNVTPATVRYYYCSFRPLLPLLEKVTDARSLKAAIEDCIEALVDKGLSPVSINCYGRCWQAYTNWLAEQEVIQKPFRIQKRRCQKCSRERYTARVQTSAGPLYVCGDCTAQKVGHHDEKIRRRPTFKAVQTAVDQLNLKIERLAGAVAQLCERIEVLERRLSVVPEQKSLAEQIREKLDQGWELPRSPVCSGPPRSTCGRLEPGTPQGDSPLGYALGSPERKKKIFRPGAARSLRSRAGASPSARPDLLAEMTIDRMPVVMTMVRVPTT